MMSRAERSVIPNDQLRGLELCITNEVVDNAVALKMVIRWLSERKSAIPNDQIVRLKPVPHISSSRVERGVTSMRSKSGIEVTAYRIRVLVVEWYCNGKSASIPSIVSESTTGGKYRQWINNL
ncbi:hypothetical protein [Parasitella parasitica]|uniref:Uncharacterized protein n=1 Tax=Parasitella parasitica TaxID=35722 RepID=A0A0B7NM83_9FUNG|nr:hypothetical protein [Parasitella parasitica]